MAGHSHWAKVRHYKVISDARKGKLFSKLSREITVAARLGGGDPDFNPRLRRAIQAARAESMPMENIERAILKGTGQLAGEAWEDVCYEGYGPGGVAILVQALTDNRNRTAAEIRSIFARHGGNLAGVGSVAWLFQKRGVVLIEGGEVPEETIWEAALEAGAEDIRASDEGWEVITPVEKLESVQRALESAHVPIQSASLAFLPQTLVPIEDPDTARSVLRLCDALEAHDDVQHVYSNFDIASDILAEEARR
ncbi:YebC/PmpR family DNA-binding transcriptional regulator [Candidatus Methylacidithermus pantelleriae]|uniref:Probable transcriptional regulatory protein MPNT_140024 n=1 Tax=Candidatus Methylacidithermus pantelleriae TaxID=2744239 RepID=A0A8J2BNF6_9BACT|nr:YebC/PmpR family DNA-binding transcriptional regulator [Candidatus Methylacidithermus pantelleriae]CAF0693504.1 putative transcriptional regulatory protein Minf_0651 [Candidatus Methylacidithermus pantelleriae]